MLIGFQVNLDILLLKFLELFDDRLTESLGTPIFRLLGIGDDFILQLLTLCDPGMRIGKDGLRVSEIEGILGKFVRKIVERLDFFQPVQSRSVGFDFFGGIFEVLEFRRGVECLKALQKLFRLVHLRGQGCDFIFFQEACAPERNAVGEFLPGEH